MKESYYRHESFCGLLCASLSVPNTKNNRRKLHLINAKHIKGQKNPVGSTTENEDKSSEVRDEFEDNTKQAKGPPSTGSSDDNDEQLYCVCRRPNSPEKPTAQCSQCKDWFHPTCVGCKDIEDIAVISPWLCPNCTTRQTEKTTLKKTKLSFILRNNDCEQTGRDNVDITKQKNDNEDTRQTKQCDEPEHNPSQSHFTITLKREEWEMIRLPIFVSDFTEKQAQSRL
ncbi:set1 complex component spp1-like [Megalobrama amblycephala]|uniref:set1 complex component spp1-like n=1 Tax=Megalobrama amblycephala TaxID=75352 RepID=UPI0020145913|nr:set1 complex component spp1-like [Megalobrama amblycephala]